MTNDKDEATGRIIVPKEMAGKWIAWSTDGSAIIASAATLLDVLAKAKSTGETDASFEKVPPADVRLVGVAR